MKYIISFCLAFIMIANICYADTEPDMQDLIRFLEGERAKKDKTFFVETGIGTGWNFGHREHFGTHSHHMLLTYDFNGKIGFGSGTEKWFWALEYANIRNRCEYEYTLNDGSPQPLFVKERRSTFTHTGGIGFMYYPIPEFQISITFPVGLNFSVAYDHKLNENHSLLAGVKIQKSVGTQSEQVIIFCKYRFTVRKYRGA
jgi:hypothetical protein